MSLIVERENFSPSRELALPLRTPGRNYSRILYFYFFLFSVILRWKNLSPVSLFQMSPGSAPTATGPLRLKCEVLIGNGFLWTSLSLAGILIFSDICILQGFFPPFFLFFAIPVFIRGLDSYSQSTTRIHFLTFMTFAKLCNNNTPPPNPTPLKSMKRKWF